VTVNRQKHTVKEINVTFVFGLVLTINFIKKIIMKITLTTILVLLFTNITIAQTTSIPDANFEQALIDLGYDTGIIDGLVPTANIDTVTTLYIGFNGISDLTGIEDFTAITVLFCSSSLLTSLDITQNTALTQLAFPDNQITNIDVSQNTALTYLNLTGNQLTSLNVTQNTSLTNLICTDNLLTTIDLAQNTALTYLNCEGNQLISLDLSQNTTLQQLSCGGNELINLDLTQNTALTYLNCDGNQLTSLDVTQNTSLAYLICSGNQLTHLNLNTTLITLWCIRNNLTSLDVSQNTSLTDLRCDYNQITNLDVTQNTVLDFLSCIENQLTSLDVSQNTALTYLNCQANQLNCLNVKNSNYLNVHQFWANNNPNLTCIEVDNVAFSTTYWINIDAQTSFSQNCSNACSTVGINETISTDISTYPNPTNGLFTISLTNINQMKGYTITTLEGRVVKQANNVSSNNIEVDLTNESKGVYLLRINENDSNKVYKIVRQ